MLKRQSSEALSSNAKKPCLSPVNARYILQPSVENIKHTKIPLNGKISIGRAPDCDIVILDPAVSGVHCIVSDMDGELLVEDKSSNGTSVHGKKIGKGKATHIVVNDEFVIVSGKNVQKISFIVAACQ
ncbi:SMAD/FHA domain-containing protein [Chytridium lagenaria]|nr:SMAD/FHA domain-containing protein [Chytridium lagenaria]